MLTNKIAIYLAFGEKEKQKEWKLSNTENFN